MRRVADARENPIVVPIVRIPADVDVPVVIVPAVEGGPLYGMHSAPPAPDSSQDLYLIRQINCSDMPHQVSSFLRSLHAPRCAEP